MNSNTMDAVAVREEFNEEVINMVIELPTMKVHEKGEEKSGLKVGKKSNKENSIKLSKEAGKIPLTQFTVFSKLPLELQDMIWSFHCAMSGRLVELAVKYFPYWDFDETENERYDAFYPRWVFKAPAPSVLHVCRESRKEGLRSYELGFPTYVLWEEAFPPRIYYNDFADTLYLTHKTFKGYWNGSIRTFTVDMKEVRSLAVDVSLLDDKIGRWHMGVRIGPKQNVSEGVTQRLDLSTFVKTFTRLEKLDLAYEIRDKMCGEENFLPREPGQTLLQQLKNAWAVVSESTNKRKRRNPPEIRLVKRSTLKPSANSNLTL